MKSLIALGVTAAVVASSTRADACTDTGTIGYSDNAYVAPASGTTLPANVGRMFFHSAQNCPPPAISSLRLTDATGSNIALTTDAEGAWDAVLTPAAPLAVGDYKLTYRDQFDGGECSTPGAARDSNFSVVAAVPPPTALGTITQSTETLEQRDDDAGCSYGYVARVASLRVAPSPSLSPYASVVAYEVSVGGKVVTTTRYGANAISIAARCSGFGRIPVGGAGTATVEAGAHEVSVLAKIAGGQVPSPTAVTLTVDLTCPTSGPDGGTEGGTDGGTDGGIDAGIDGGIDAGSPPAPAESTDSGCSVAMLGASGGASAVGAFVVTAAALLRRRRRARRVTRASATAPR